MSVVVERLRTTIHSPVPIADERREAWLEALAAQDGEALGAGLVEADEWLLIRHLSVATGWRADAVDADAGRLWGRALRHSIEDALAHNDGGNCVRYANRGAAIADLLYRSALGERTRQWAWQRMGLIERPEVDCGAAIESGVQWLLRTPEWVWPVLQRIVGAEEETAALSATLRGLPAAAWMRLFTVCPQTAPYVRAAGEADAGSAGVDPAEPSGMHASLAAGRLIAWAATRSHFVHRHADTLTVLLAALARPGSGGRGGATSTRRARQARAQLLGASVVGTPAAAAIASGPKPSSPKEQLERGRTHGRRTVQIDREKHVPQAEAVRELPELTDSTEWALTEWAGALFWLGRMETSGALEHFRRVCRGGSLDPPRAGLKPGPYTEVENAPDQLDQQPDDSGDQQLLLRAVARALGVPDGDAALTVFCGGTVPETEIPASVSTLADALVAQWSEWLDDVAPDLPEPRIEAVCRRSGRLRLEPGWVELHLPLTSVVTAIRRIGLDLDPGWLPWLGCVVRIHYDE